MQKEEIASQKVLRRVVSDYRPDGSIGLGVSLCDRVNVAGKTSDLNWDTLKATPPPSQEYMIGAAAMTWAPSDSDLQALAKISASTVQAVTAILGAFTGINKAAALRLFAERDQPIEIAPELT